MGVTQSLGDFLGAPIELQHLRVYLGLDADSPT